MSIKHLSIAAVLLMTGHSVAAAQNCEKNFKASGVPLVTPVYYKTWQEFPKLKPEAALQRMARGSRRKGFQDRDQQVARNHRGLSGYRRLRTAADVARRCPQAWFRHAG